jgi:Fibronectin type III-like domain
LSAGIDVELPATDCYGPPLLDALEAGILALDVVDRAVARVLRAKFELKAFARVVVPAGRAWRAAFTLPVRQLGFRDRGLRYVVEPGEIEVHVGTSVERLSPAGSFTVVSDNGPVEVEEVFGGRVEVGDRFVAGDEEEEEQG